MTHTPPQRAAQPRTVHLLGQGAGLGAPQQRRSAHHKHLSWLARSYRGMLGCAGCLWLARHSVSNYSGGCRPYDATSRGLPCGYTPVWERTRVVLEQLGAVRLVQEGQVAQPRRRLEQDWPSGWRGQCRSHPVSIDAPRRLCIALNSKTRSLNETRWTRADISL